MYEKALLLDPQNAEAIHNQGVVYTALGNHQQALLCYQQAITILDNHYYNTNHNSIIEILTNLSKNTSLTNTIEALNIPHDSLYIQPLRGICITYLSLERYREAIIIANYILHWYPNDPFIWADKAYALLKLIHIHDNTIQDTLQNKIQRTEEAVKAYNKVTYILITEKEKQKYTWYNQQNIPLLNLDKEIKKYYGIALSQLAVLLDQNQDYLRAEIMYNAALQLELTETRLFNYAYLCMRMKNYNAAIKKFQQVIEFNYHHHQNNTDSLYNVKSNQYTYQSYVALGTVYCQLSLYTEACEAFNHGIEYKQNNSTTNTSSTSSNEITIPEISAEVYYNYGLALLKTNHINEAQYNFHQALNLQPTMKLAIDGLQYITNQQPNYHSSNISQSSLLLSSASSQAVETSSINTSTCDKCTITDNIHKDKEISETNSSSLSIENLPNNDNNVPLSTTSAVIETTTPTSITSLPSTSDLIPPSVSIPSHSFTNASSSPISEMIMHKQNEIETNTVSSTSIRTFPSAILVSKGSYFSNGQTTPLSFISTNLNTVSKRPLANHRGEKIDCTPTTSSIPYRRKSIPLPTSLSNNDSIEKASNTSNGTEIVQNDDSNNLKINDTETSLTISARYRLPMNNNTNTTISIDRNTEIPNTMYDYQDLCIPGPFPQDIDITHREVSIY